LWKSEKLIPEKEIMSQSESRKGKKKGKKRKEKRKGRPRTGGLVALGLS